MAVAKPIVKPGKIVVLVSDRAHAYVYETERLGAPLQRVATLENPNARRHERELGTYAPGRSFNRSAGVHQTLTPKHTLQQHDAAQFARVVAKTLELSLKSSKSEGAVLVAAPRMLAAIRRALTKTSQKKVILAIGKDLVHQPKRVLVEHLAELRSQRAA